MHCGDNGVSIFYVRTTRGVCIFNRALQNGDFYSGSLVEVCRMCNGADCIQYQ